MRPACHIRDWQRERHKTHTDKQDQVAARGDHGVRLVVNAKAATGSATTRAALKPAIAVRGPHAVQMPPKVTDAMNRHALTAVPRTARPVARTAGPSIELALAARTPSVNA